MVVLKKINFTMSLVKQAGHKALGFGQGNLGSGRGNQVLGSGQGNLGSGRGNQVLGSGQGMDVQAHPLADRPPAYLPPAKRMAYQPPPCHQCNIAHVPDLKDCLLGPMLISSLGKFKEFGVTRCTKYRGTYYFSLLHHDIAEGAFNDMLAIMDHIQSGFTMIGVSTSWMMNINTPQKVTNMYEHPHAWLRINIPMNRDVNYDKMIDDITTRTMQKGRTDHWKFLPSITGSEHITGPYAGDLVYERKKDQLPFQSGYAKAIPDILNADGIERFVWGRHAGVYVFGYESEIKISTSKYGPVLLV
jgi:hypothetical protein